MHGNLLYLNLRLFDPTTKISKIKYQKSKTEIYTGWVKKVWFKAPGAKV